MKTTKTLKNMKLLKHLTLALLAALAAGSCAKPDDEFVHDDATISAIYISPAFSDVPATVSGEIDQQTGKILFPIRKSLQSYFDIRQVKVRANVGYDVRITPSLSGIKNLEEEYAITVTATQTGRTKNYTLRAYNDVN